jgi:hypothetical protein
VTEPAVDVRQPRADEVAAGKVVCRSIFEDPGEDGEAAWDLLGSQHSVFVCFRLLQTLLEAGLERHAYPDVFAYAREAHGRAAEPAPPLWLVEAISRAMLGEPQLGDGLDLEPMVEVAAMLVLDLVDVLDLDDDEVADVIRQVAEGPVPTRLRQSGR